MFSNNMMIEERQQNCIEYLDSREWKLINGLRIQEYGYRQEKDYLVTTELIPELFHYHVAHFDHSLHTKFNRMVVTEYLRGHVMEHKIESSKLYGPIIVHLVLKSACYMALAHSDLTPIQYYVPERTAITIAEHFRYNWTYSVPSKWPDRNTAPERCIILTFYNVIW
jgi:hypothetical protein